jgi:hypothetical protein
MKVAINGAGIAGTALAYWLGRQGHEVLLVENAPELRVGGFVLNLWGIGYDAVERMGLLPKLLALQHHSDELRMVDRRGRTRGGYPSSVLLKLAKGRMATLARSDIAAAIYGSLDGRVETLFGDSISAIDDNGTRVATGTMEVHEIPTAGEQVNVLEQQAEGRACAQGPGLHQKEEDDLHSRSRWLGRHVSSAKRNEIPQARRAGMSDHSLFRKHGLQRRKAGHVLAAARHLVRNSQQLGSRRSVSGTADRGIPGARAGSDSLRL